MKINYVSYLNPYKFSGGGEVVLKALLDYGSHLGHDIRITSTLPVPSFSIHKTNDFYFLADVYNCPLHWKRFHRKILSKLPISFLNKYFKMIDHIVKNEPYVHFDNSYVDVCDRGYLPCNGNTKEFVCEFKKKGDPCFSQNRTALYRNSKLNIFVSPLHRKTISKIIGAENIGKSHICKPLIDSSIFYNKNQERDIDNLYVGAICEAKGLENLRSIYKNKAIVLIGHIASGERLDFGKYIGKVAYHKVAEYMNRAKNFIYLPRWPEPQGRVVVEAALCGCNLITNDNVGAVSFNFDIVDPKNMIITKAELWNKIAEVIANGK